MKPEDIKDEASLKAWLDTQPREVAITIAHRAAMRVAPLFWMSVPPLGDGLDSTIFAVSRPNVISGLAGAASVHPSIFSAAGAAADATEFTTTNSARVDAVAAAAAGSSRAAARAASYTSSDASRSAATDASTDASRALKFRSSSLWHGVRNDARAFTMPDAEQEVAKSPLWPYGWEPYDDKWQFVRAAWAATATKDPGWQFWIDWYDAALDGRPLLGTWDRHWALLTDIALIDREVWDNGPDALNPVVARIYDSHKSPPPSPLAQAAITDFTFDAAFHLMRAVGFEDDLIHLRDPIRVQAFLDDIEEARDGLTYFSDYASEASGQTNTPRVLVRAAENLLEELRRTKDTAHLRARRLITLGRHLEGFANEEPKRAELGETLAEMLDESIAIVRDACRQHLAPSLAALSALDGLELGDIDPRDLIARLEAAIRTIDSADGATLVPLAPGDVAMLRDMLDELRDLEASLGEARTDGFKERQRGKIARTAGQLGATLGRYTEKASKRAEDAGKALDGAVKWYRRWGSLSEVLDWLKDTFDSGGPLM